jgi:glycine/D-amino acid oxidase-like deaminating enzyme
LKKLVDYIIVGQGIAGTILAHELLKKNKNIIFLNNENLSSSSKVAAGIWNPVVFKRLTKSWLADDLIPSLNLDKSHIIMIQI